MKKSLISIAIILMVLLLPLTSIAQEEAVKTGAEEEKQRIIKVIEDNFIEKFGIDEHIKLSNKITCAIYSYFYNYVLYDYSDGYVKVVKKSLEIDNNIDTTDYETLINQLIAFCELIAELCWLTFGHGSLGNGIAYLSCMILMFIPCRLVTMIGYIEGGLIDTFLFDLIELLNEFNLETNLNLAYFFYQYGILGGLFFLLLLSPIILILSPIILTILLVGFPITRLMNTFELLFLITNEVFT